MNNILPPLPTITLSLNGTDFVATDSEGRQYTVHADEAGVQLLINMLRIKTNVPKYKFKKHLSTKDMIDAFELKKHDDEIERKIQQQKELEEMF